MKSAFRWLSALLVAVSIGTSISLVVLLIMLWWKGVLADERVLGMLAALQGIRPASLTADGMLSTDADRPSPNELLQARLRASLDLDLRESAIDKSLGDLRTIETQLRSESTRLDDWKKSFDKRLSDLQTAATDASLAEVQRTLEVMDPKQAKDQIIRMLDQPPAAGENAMQDIITILKQMPLDKRKKILGSFKSDPEIEKLHDILREILRGGADADLLRDTRSQLQQQGNP
jgi:hypothetical protein